MFQQNPAHPGRQPSNASTNFSFYCGAPFVFNGAYDGGVISPSA